MATGSEKVSPNKPAKKLIKPKLTNPLHSHKINQVISYANEFL